MAESKLMSLCIALDALIHMNDVQYTVTTCKGIVELVG